MSILLREQMALLSGGSISLFQRQLAATAAGNADIANGGPPFYAAIGGPTGSPLWNNNNVGFGLNPPTASTLIPVASVSKTLYVIYASQIAALTNTDKQYLNLQSQWNTAHGRRCDNTGALPLQNVAQCLVTFGAGNASFAGKFDYDSEHMQYHLANILAGGTHASDTRATMGPDYRAKLGVTQLQFSSCMPAGGVDCTPTVLAAVAQKILTSTYANYRAMLASWTPVQASDYFGTGTVINSPAPADEPWLYVGGTWVEPITGDFWMSGSYGTSLWIKNDFSLWGIVARNIASAGGEMGVVSIRTLQSIRDAYLAGRYNAAPPPLENPDNTQNQPGMVVI